MHSVVVYVFFIGSLTWLPDIIADVPQASHKTTNHNHSDNFSARAAKQKWWPGFWPFARRGGPMANETYTVTVTSTTSLAQKVVASTGDFSSSMVSNTGRSKKILKTNTSFNVLTR